MANLTRKQLAELDLAFRHARRAHDYLTRPDVAVARKGQPATTTLHYTRADGSTLYEVNKEYGSDLTGLETAMSVLESFIAKNRGNN